MNKHTDNSNKKQEQGDLKEIQHNNKERVCCKSLATFLIELQCRWVFTLFLQATKTLRVSRGIALLFLGPRHSRWRWGVSSTPRTPLTPGKTRYPFYRMVDVPQDRSGRAKNLVPTGIRSRIVQSVDSRYTD